MAVYAIGDLQGCYASLQNLLEKISFDEQADTLWLTGDLINRGPQSLETLRFVRKLGESAIAVLGNHDLHVLAVAHGFARSREKDQTMDLLSAPDRDELLAWLRNRPLMHADKQLGYVMVHAGLVPQWTTKQALALAREIEAVLRGDRFESFLEHMYGDEPEIWHDDLEGWDRLRFITNSLTRLRFCDINGRMNLLFKGPPGSQPAELLPWFQVPARASKNETIIFGHWSTLSTYTGDNVVCLDSGCLWGHKLTAARLDSNQVSFRSVGCPAYLKPQAD